MDCKCQIVKVGIPDLQRLFILFVQQVEKLLQVAVRVGIQYGYAAHRIEAADFAAVTAFSGVGLYDHVPQLAGEVIVAIKDQFGLLPEDRKKQGLLLMQSIRINTTLASLDKITKMGVIDQKKEKSLVERVLKNIHTKYGKMEDNANSLSGGNQQKVALAKWIAADCKCMVFDEPTRGVDVGAKAEIYRTINQLAESGVAIIMISSEMPEVIGMCDRVIIMRNGMIRGEIPKEEMTEHELIKYSMGVN